MKTIIIFMLGVCTHLSFSQVHKKTECPPNELIPSCSCERETICYDWKFPNYTCKYKTHIHLNCSDVMNRWDFLKIAHSLEYYDIYALEYHHINMNFLPKGFLKYLPVRSLIFRESAIFGMETDDGEEMFEGATESIEKFHLYSVDGASSWRWKALRSLRNLTSLEIFSSGLTQIGSEFNDLPKYLKKLSFRGNKISYVDDDAVNSQRELQELNFADNQISAVRRSMFPDPAMKLAGLSFSNNKVRNLPNGIFENMPSLRIVDLSLNNIKWLPFTVFEPIHLKTVVILMGNNIYCCGAQEWIIETKFQERILGTCSAPVSLVGKEINRLSRKDLKHGLC